MHIHGPALRALGLGELVFKDVSTFAASAGELARSPGERSALRRKTAAIAADGEGVAAEIATTIEQGARAMLGKTAA